LSNYLDLPVRGKTRKRLFSAGDNANHRRTNIDIP
jgi:hypothetical protein